MLLWNFCHRFPNANTEGELLEVGSEVAVEAEAIENALNNHTCNLDAELLYCCRVYVHKCVWYMILSELLHPTRITVVPTC